MNHQSLPVWGVDVFSESPLAGHRAVIVGNTAGLRSTQQERIIDAFPGVPVGLISTQDQELELIAQSETDGHPEHLPIACLATTETTPQSILGGGTQHPVTTIGQSPGITLEPPTASIETLADPLDEALGGVSRGTLSVGTDELPPALVTLHRRWVVIPLTYFSELSDVTSDAATTLCEKYDAAGVCALTFDTLTADTPVHIRTISSDPTAGLVTAGGAVGAYLRHYDAIDATEIAVAAGLDDPAHRLTVSLGETVAVGGQTTPFLTGDLTVPDPDDDPEFIEA